MKIRTLAAVAAAFTMACGTGAIAQTTQQTKVDHDTKVHDGVATTTTKVTETNKRTTRQPKKVLGVKVGHKTVTHKTVKESSVSTDGDSKTTVKTSN